MKTSFSLSVLLSMGALSYSTIAWSAESYVINLVADAMILSPAANNLGSFTFLNQGGGLNAYSYTIKRPDGSITEDEFYSTARPEVYLPWVDIQRSVNVVHDIQFGRFGRESGALKLTRNAGQAVGAYTISGTPVGTVSGQFGIVRFSGIIQKPANDFRSSAFLGVLSGSDNPFGAPQVLGFNPGSGDDFVGTQSGMDYKFSFYLDGTVIVADGTSSPKPWRWFRGTYAKMQSDGANFTLTLQSSPGVGSPWTSMLTIPLLPNGTQSIYRLVIAK